jgi:ligand-binding sensor domain-containing protein/signal transduction histidine kinase
VRIRSRVSHAPTLRDRASNTARLFVAMRNKASFRSQRAASRAVCLFVLAFALAMSSGFAALAPEYITRFWQTEDGLPQDAVTAVTQTRDGYVWLGTRNGLARFDGVHFKVFEDIPGMESRHVTCLFEAADGALWIGHDDGVLNSYKDGKFQLVPVRAAWHGGKIFSIAADEAGDIWLLNQAAELVRLRDGFVIPSPQTITHLLSLARKPKGGFWLQRDTEVSVLEGTQLKPLVFDTPATNRYIQGIAASRDGGLWVMTENRVEKWRDGKLAEDFGTAPWEWSPVHTLIETHEGQLAAATADYGIYLVAPGQGFLRFCRTNGFSTDWITSICEDREGNLWAGTGNGGLAGLRAVNVTTLSPPDRWQGRAVLSVASGSDGALWLGTEGAGVYRYRDGQWTNFDERAGLQNRYVWSVLVDAKGHLWAGTWGNGLFVENDGRFQPAPGLQDLSAPVTALLAARHGGLYVGTAAGLLRYDEGNLTWLARKGEFSSPDVRAVQEAPDGSVWFGTFGGGLGHLKDGVIRQFRKQDGLSSDSIQALHIDCDGVVWIGTLGGGLNRLKNGHFSVISTAQGLPNNVICHITEDDRGYVWMSSYGGVLRASKSELDRCADGTIPWVQCRAYSTDDGMPALECSGGMQPAGCKTADGRQWFCMSKGLVSVNPDNVKINKLPPPVFIEAVLADDEVLPWPAGDSPLRIPPGRQRIQFRYTGLSFVAPEKVSFRYRLGEEAKWLDAGTMRSITYNQIAPGDYAFHVIACNSDGFWNSTGATLAFKVLPYFWQTWWFHTLTAVAAAGLVAGSVLVTTRRRMRMKLERLERQQALERERARIAKDIHDDLGASLTRITLLSQSARSELNGAPEAAGNLDQIYSTARELTRAMDEIVWAVNPQHDTLDSLASYLGKFAQDYLRSAGIRCRLNVPVQLPPWPLSAEVRHNLFLGFKEVLHNVVKHANASSVRITLSLHAAAFALVIEDDGRGFVPEAVAAKNANDADRIENGNGLANIKCRLAEIHGRCEIRSAPGSGTRVELNVPVRIP